MTSIKQSFGLYILNMEGRSIASATGRDVVLLCLTRKGKRLTRCKTTVFLVNSSKVIQNSHPDHGVCKYTTN